MNPLSGIGLTLAFLAAIFVYGYGKGYRSCEANVSLIKTYAENAMCKLKLGSVRDLGDGVVVCVKSKRV